MEATWGRDGGRLSRPEIDCLRDSIPTMRRLLEKARRSAIAKFVTASGLRRTFSEGARN